MARKNKAKKTDKKQAAASTARDENPNPFILIIAPFFVFLTGAFIASQKSQISAEYQFLTYFGGLVLCLGTVFVYAVALTKRVNRTKQPSNLASKSQHTDAKIHQLKLFFTLFAIAAFIQFFSIGLLSLCAQNLAVIFGIVYVNLTAHYHAHH